MAMTTKTQKLIDPSDLLALHLECKTCKTTVSVSLQGAVYRIPNQCFNCSGTWFQLGDDGPKKALNNFIEAHNFLIRTLAHNGVELRIEVTNDPAVLPKTA